MNYGFVKLWRKIMDSEVFLDSKLLQLWIYCIIKASHRSQTVSLKTGKKSFSIKILPGQFVFCRGQAAQETGQNRVSLYKRLMRLRGNNQISVEGNNHFSIITICNWESYQTSQLPMGNNQKSDEGNNQGTSKPKKVNNKVNNYMNNQVNNKNKSITSSNTSILDDAENGEGNKYVNKYVNNKVNNQPEKKEQARSKEVQEVLQEKRREVKSYLKFFKVNLKLKDRREKPTPISGPTSSGKPSLSTKIKKRKNNPNEVKNEKRQVVTQKKAYLHQWGCREVLTWTGLDFVGYYLAEYLKLYSVPDTSFVTKPKKEILKLCGPVASVQKLVGGPVELKKYVDWCFEKKKDPDYWRKGALTIYQIFCNNGKSMYNDFLGEKHSATLGPSKNACVLDRQNELGRYHEEVIEPSERTKCYRRFFAFRKEDLKNRFDDKKVTDYIVRFMFEEQELFEGAVPEDMTADHSDHYFNWFVNYLKENLKW